MLKTLLCDVSVAPGGSPSRGLRCPAPQRVRSRRRPREDLAWTLEPRVSRLCPCRLLSAGSTGGAGTFAVCAPALILGFESSGSVSPPLRVLEPSPRAGVGCGQRPGCVGAPPGRGRRAAGRSLRALRGVVAARAGSRCVPIAWRVQSLVRRRAAGGPWGVGLRSLLRPRAPSPPEPCVFYGLSGLYLV